MTPLSQQYYIIYGQMNNYDELIGKKKTKKQKQYFHDIYGKSNNLVVLPRTETIFATPKREKKLQKIKYYCELAGIVLYN